MKTALLIIDVQNVMFTHDGGVYNKFKVLENIKFLLNKARKESVPVFFIQHTTTQDGPFNINNESRGIHPDIAPMVNEVVIPKYSWDSFLDTNLKKELEDKNITKIIIAGMQTEFCVDTTTRSAYSNGYKDNILVSDAHTTWDSKVINASQIIAHHNITIGNRFAKLSLTKDIVF